MQNLQQLLTLLIKSPIDFVLVGGFAAVLHGSNQTTRDIDICLSLDLQQIELLREVLAPIHPIHRLSPEKISFLTFPENFSDTTELYLSTDWGILDVMSRIEAVGGYFDLLRNAKKIDLLGSSCFIISIDDLIKSKRALGRHRDIATILELEAIQREIAPHPVKA